MTEMEEQYMKLANSFERKKCRYLDNHICPLKPSRARKGESCDGCSLLEKVLAFKQISLEIEEHDSKLS